MARVLNVVIGVLSTVLALAAVWSGAWLNAFGPDLPGGPLVRTAIQAMVWGGALALTLGGFANLVGRLPGPSFDRVPMARRVRAAAFGAAVFGAFLATGFAMWQLTAAVDALVFEQRGRTTTCTVLDVTERVETSTDADGHSGSRTYYDHALDCAAADVRTMTTRVPAAEPGQPIEVRYDPLQRIQPRPADDTADPARPLRLGLLGVVLAGILRGMAELRRRDRPDAFFPSTDGLRRVGVGVSVFVIAGVATLLATAAFQGTTVLRSTVLTWFGVDPVRLQRHWYDWLVSLPFWLVGLVAFAAVVGVLARVFIRLLAACPFFDPYGTLREGLDAMATGVEYSVAGVTIPLAFRALRPRRRQRQ